ncbi:hypothetical protein [Neolewinella agarilytica]|uniref:Uncharacterized protein n=1 Tax=Neolewinella agarilytica TaxID=478744 RepID=A0A1H9PHM2_9BACT|nr:hypothetical protein [Neolewinella agarilytica]SER47722.1 hypothetical protein SAMN05444359_1531 [Neolewinella agarilytica]
MKPYYKTIFLLSCVLSFGVSAQSTLRTDDEANSLKGSIWLSGNSRLLDENLLTGAGYFFTENLLIGSKLESLNLSATDYQVSFNPFIRYYVGKIGNGWRPYAQVDANFVFGGDFDAFYSYGGKVGLERRLNTSTLLNIDIGYTKTQFLDSDDLGLSVRLNTVLGGAAGKSVATDYFQKGNFIVSGQLINLLLSNNQLTDGYFVNITPNGNYFLLDRFVIEGSLGLNFNDFSQNIGLVERELAQQELNLAGGLRYYITSQSLFNVFARATLLYNYRQTTVDNSNDSQGEVFAAYELGNSLFINRSTSFDLGINVTQGFNDRTSGFEWVLSGRLSFWFQ